MEAIAEFPFVEGLPVCTVDETSLTKQERLHRRLAMLKAMVESDGQLVPVALAADILGVSRQRIHEIIGKDQMKSVKLHGAVYVTENSLVDFVQSERRNGRPPKTPSLPQMAKMAAKFGRES